MNEQEPKEIPFGFQISRTEFLEDFITLKGCIPKNVENISHKEHKNAEQDTPYDEREHLDILLKTVAEGN